jgi:hypothetical protein
MLPDRMCSIQNVFSLSCSETQSFQVMLYDRMCSLCCLIECVLRSTGSLRVYRTAVLRSELSLASQRYLLYIYIICIINMYLWGANSLLHLKVPYIYIYTYYIYIYICIYIYIYVYIYVYIIYIYIYTYYIYIYIYIYYYNNNKYVPLRSE